MRRLTGASRRRKHRCWISAASSDATLPADGASCTIIHRPVLFTLLTTVSICEYNWQHQLVFISRMSGHAKLTS